MVRSSPVWHACILGEGPLRLRISAVEHPEILFKLSVMSGRRFPPELDPITANQPMTAEQAAALKRLAEAAYELDAFKPNLTRAEADVRIAMLTAKLKLLDEPPHTL